MLQEASPRYQYSYSLISMTLKTRSLMTLMKHCKHIFIPLTLGMMVLVLVMMAVMTKMMLLLMMTVALEKVMMTFHYREIAPIRYVTVTQLTQDPQQVP